MYIDVNSIDWNKLPDILNKSQFCELCHISKATARYLLINDIVPNTRKGENTSYYKIRKEDIKNYILDKKITPEKYAAEPGWYGTSKDYSLGLPLVLSQSAEYKLHKRYKSLLKNYKDLMSVSDICKLTGYSRDTVNLWCCENRFPRFKHNRIYYVPKAFLIDFFCTKEFRTISRKTKWHIQTLRDFKEELDEESKKPQSAK